MRFTKAEMAALRWMVRTLNKVMPESGDEHDEAIDSLMHKLVDAEKTNVKPIAVAVSHAHGAMEAVLGVGTVAMPRHAAAAFFAKMTRCIQAGKYTGEDFTAAAEAIRNKGWAPPYSFERTVYSMDRLLAPGGAQNWITNGPLSMEDL